MAEVLFTCSACGTHLAMEEAGIGQVIECTACAQTVPVPEPTAELGCPACQRLYKAAEDIIHEEVRCPTCQRSLQLFTEDLHHRKKLTIKEAIAPSGSVSTGEDASVRHCPNCNAVMLRFSIVCDNCGFNINTGHVTRKSVTLDEILKSPFYGDLPADALWLVLRAIGWAATLIVVAVLNVFMGGLLLEYTAMSFPSLIEWSHDHLGGVPWMLLWITYTAGATVVVAVRACAWGAQEGLAVAEQYERGALVAESERSRLMSLLLLLLVTAIAVAPLLLGWLGVRWLGLADPAHRAGFWGLTKVVLVAGWLLIISAPWAVLYWPMGLGMAGAYGVANPVRVVRKILGTLAGYLIVLAYLVPFGGLVLVVAELLGYGTIFLIVIVGGFVAKVGAMGLGPLLSGPGQVGLWVWLQELARAGLEQPLAVIFGFALGSLLGLVLVLYTFLSILAMVGTLLRKYKRPQPLERTEKISSFKWVGVAAALGIVMLILRLSHAWTAIPDVAFQFKQRANRPEVQWAVKRTPVQYPAIRELTVLVARMPQIYNAIEQTARGEPIQPAAAPVGVAVTVANTKPTISHTADQTTPEDTPVGPLEFFVSDAETLPMMLKVVAVSSEPKLVSPTDVSLGGGGTNRTVTITPAANKFGKTILTLTVSDGRDQASDSFTVTVTPVPDPPVAADVQVTTDEDLPLKIAAPGLRGNVSDPDPDDQPTVALVQGPQHAAEFALNPDGSFQYLSRRDYNGKDSFTYRANDGQFDSNVATVNITINPVNDPPVATNDTYAVDEDTVLNRAAPGLLANDTDVDIGTKLRANLVQQPAHGTLELQPTGAFAYRPATNYFGSDSFTYKANDGEADSEVTTVNLTVNPVNDPPDVKPETAVTDEDTPLMVNAPGVLGNDTDIENDALTAHLVSLPAHGSVYLNKDGGYTYKPAQDYNGTDSFRYKANDGQADSEPVAVTIKINPVNDAPVAVKEMFAVDEDDTLAKAAPGVLANDRDVDIGDKLTVALVTGPANAASFTLNPDGSFNYTPKPDFNGSDSFTYKANDGALDSDVATVTIAVKPVNDAPVATADSYTVDEDTALTPAAPGVLANDTDIDVGDKLNSVLVTGPAHAASFKLNADGSFNYTAKRDYNGTDFFTYKANDGLEDSKVVAVAITIRPVNDAPVATDDRFNVGKNTPVTVPAPGVLGNDTDVERDKLTAVLVQPPAHAASFTLQPDGSFSYTPQPDFTGADTFTYEASDGTASSPPATVTITIGTASP